MHNLPRNCLIIIQQNRYGWPAISPIFAINQGVRPLVKNGKLDKGTVAGKEGQATGDEDLNENRESSARARYHSLT